MRLCFICDIQLSLTHQQARSPFSAHMGCSLNPEQLRTETCSNHKATQIGLSQLGLVVEHSSVRRHESSTREIMHSVSPKNFLTKEIAIHRSLLPPDCWAKKSRRHRQRRERILLYDIFDELASIKNMMFEEWFIF